LASVGLADKAEELAATFAREQRTGIGIALPRTEALARRATPHERHRDARTVDSSGASRRT